MQIKKSKKSVMSSKDAKIKQSVACNSSTATDKALKHIKAAIDILATEAKDDEIAKDSIANLATVMFDIKGSTKIDK